MKIKVRTKYLAALCMIILFAIQACTPSKEFLLKKTGPGHADKNFVRVLILKSDKFIQIASYRRLRLRKKSNSKIIYDKRKARLTIYPEDIRGPMLGESWNSYIYINNKPYRGHVEIRKVVGKIYVINVLTMDEYLFGVVPSEIPASWHKQALKAQAVAARTYAYYHIIHNKKKSIYDLDGTTRFQVYKGVSAERKSTTEAVRETSGEVLMYNYKPILAYFHSTCGGRTIDDKYVWHQNDFKYLKGVKSNFCSASPHYKWESKLSLYEIQKNLSKHHGRIGRIKKILFKKMEGRVTDVRIIHEYGTLNISGNNFRLSFPSKTLRSTYFTTRKSGGNLLFYGKGWGHGVGMCQWSARGMADRGANYKAILHHFYNNVRHAKIKDISSYSIANRYN